MAVLENNVNTTVGGTVQLPGFSAGFSLNTGDVNMLCDSFDLQQEDSKLHQRATESTLSVENALMKKQLSELTEEYTELKAEFIFLRRQLHSHEEIYAEFDRIIEKKRNCTPIKMTPFVDRQTPKPVDFRSDVNKNTVISGLLTTKLYTSDEEIACDKAIAILEKNNVMIKKEFHQNRPCLKRQSAGRPCSFMRDHFLLDPDTKVWFWTGLKFWGTKRKL